MASALPSKKQHALLEYIDGFIKENNFAPSYREVMRALDYKSVSTVASHINGLIERGWMVKRDNSARSVEVVYKTGQGQSAPVSTPENSPTPSLPTPADWLYEKFEQLLVSENSAEIISKDAQILRDAMQILGLTELVARADAALEAMGDNKSNPEAHQIS